MAYRADRQLNAAAYSIAALSVLVCLMGAYCAITSPQVYSRNDMQRAHAAGVRGEQIPAQFRDPRVRISGILFLLVGMAGISTSALLATGDPETLEPPEVTMKGSGERLHPDTKEEKAISLIQSCERKINEFARNNQVIKWGVASRVLAITGDQGAGKTLLCDQVVTFRKIRRNDYVVIADPHYKANRARYMWLAADLILDTEEKIRLQLPTILSKALNTHRVAFGGSKKRQQAYTIVADEFSNWHSKYNLAGVAHQLLYAATQDIRKSICNIIFLTHGDKKGMFGGEDGESGRLESLLKQATVISLEVDPPTDIDAIDPVWTGRGVVSPTGRRYEESKHHIKIQVPKVLSPVSYQRKAGRYFRAALDAMKGNGGSGSSNRREETETQLLNDVSRWQQQQEEEENLPSEAGNHHHHRQSPFAAAAATSTNKRVDWDVLSTLEDENMPSLLKWLSRREFEVGELVPIETVRSAWGKNYGLNTESVISRLRLANMYGLGKFDSSLKPRHWALVAKIKEEALEQNNRVKSSV